MAALQVRPQLCWGGSGGGRRAAGGGKMAAARVRVLSVAAKGGKTPEVKRIEGVSEELNAIARQNIDFGTMRRRVRSAFIDTQQQLDHPLFKLAPSGIQMEERYEVNSRGLEIFCKSWFPPSSDDVGLKGCVFFCHGYGDTCTFFFEGIAKRIAAAGYGVFAMDYPGFGLSQGLHGYIPSFDKLVDGVIEHYAKVREKPLIKRLPHFLFGQSMGGAVALKIQLKQPDAWDGMILVAPMCKIAADVTPSNTVIKIASLLSIILPKAKLFPRQDLSELMFREPDKKKMAQFNVIAYDDKMRLRTGIELLKTTKDIESRVREVSAPLLVLHGSGDMVTDPQVSEFLYENASSSDKTLKLYEGGYHCILEGETDERIFQVLNDIISWLDVHSMLQSA
ncbi:caffeoylshikimate esterase-like [Nymphaea colorata]|nr:caffeoylshikimate esterase-like [Nymphaea colorata]